MFEEWNIITIITIVLSTSFNLRNTILIIIAKSIEAFMITLWLSRLSISSLIILIIVQSPSTRWINRCLLWLFCFMIRICIIRWLNSLWTVNSLLFWLNSIISNRFCFLLRLSLNLVATSW